MTSKTKSISTTETTPDAVLCEYCGKPITRSGSMETGHGARCAFVRATLGDSNAQKVHLARYTNAAIVDDKNYVKLADVSRAIDAAGITSRSRFVTAFGTDKNAKAPKHIALTPIYTPKRTRYIHKYWLTKTGQTIIATNQWQKVPARVTAQAMAVVGAADAKPVK